MLQKERTEISLRRGGVANSTNVSATFSGLIKALGEYREELLEHRVQIWVRELA